MYIEFDTTYNHYSVADVIYHDRPARVLYSGSQEAAQSGMPLDGKPELLFDYIRRFMELIAGVRPQSVLMLGGGAFTLPSAVLEQFPDIRMDIVEIDGELLEIAGRFFEFRPSDNTQVHITDARAFIDRTENSYDAIIVDVFTHDSVPSGFMTSEAAAALRRCLTKDGVLAMNIIASIDGRQADPLRRIYENLQAIFPDVQVFPSSTGLSSWTAQNFIVTAQSTVRDIAQYMRFPPLDGAELRRQA